MRNFAHTGKTLEGSWLNFACG